jgi:hypothetical protein
MAQKVNVILVGRNETDIIVQFMNLIAKKGGRIVNIVSEYKDADMEVDITNYKGTTDLDKEINFILNAALLRANMLKKQKKVIKVTKRKINRTDSLIKKLHENSNENIL